MLTLLALGEGRMSESKSVPGFDLFESDTGEKPMEKVYAAIVGQRLRTKSNTECSRAFGHPAEPYLIGRVQCNGVTSSTSASLAASTDSRSTLHA